MMPVHIFNSITHIHTCQLYPGSRVVSVLAFNSGGRDFKAWPEWRNSDSPVPVGNQTPVELDASYSDGT